MAEVQGGGTEEDSVESEESEDSDLEGNKAKLMVRNSEMIPDSLLEEALEYLNIGRKEKAEVMCLSVDLNKSEDPLIPPYHWNGEGMKPVKLVQLLFGKERFNGINDVEEELDYKEAGEENIGENGGLRTKWDGKRDKILELQEEIVKVYKEVTGMDIYDIVESGKTKQRWGGNRIHVLCCKKCGIAKEKNYPIIRLQYMREVKEKNVYVFYLRILDCFFHQCDSKENVKKVLEEKTGHLVLNCNDSSWMEELRKKAFDGWVKTLHRYNDPEKELPPGTRVQFPSKRAVLDNRSQVELEEGLPEGMDENAEKSLKQYMAWIIYKVVCDLGIAREFTKYLPIPFEESNRKNGISAGHWKCEKRSDESVPVHLYVEGLALLFGGMALDEKGKLVKKNSGDAVVHQSAMLIFTTKGGRTATRVRCCRVF